ncbi:MAG: hypothetical protein AAGF23_01325, partial [Acidobacteriota bacterium]
MTRTSRRGFEFQTGARRVLFAALTVFGVIVVIEAFSACCLWWLDDTGNRFAAAGESAVGPGAGEDAADGFDPRQGMVLHPFLGFVADAETAPRLGKSEVGRRFGFPFNRYDPVQPKSDDALVVGLFGGSFAEQTYVFAHRELTQGLASIDRFAGRRVVLLNLAAGGYKQPQQLQALTYLLSLGGHVDVAINLDGFNEVALVRPENVELGTHPSFPRSWRLRVDDLGPE